MVGYGEEAIGDAVEGERIPKGSMILDLHIGENLPV
jgi:hypothetical protein